MTTHSTPDIDHAIAAYRARISREADIGRATLDEIEDHMRLLIDDLTARGLPIGAAITEAARRLGDPRELAREHARVRTPFGAKLPLWRAIAVYALVLPQIIWGPIDDTWVGTAERVLGAALCGALLLRSAWSRAALFGVMGWSVVWTMARLGVGMDDELRVENAVSWWLIAAQLGALALLVPWRRSDLTAPGWALALVYPMYSAAAWFMGWQVTAPDGTSPVPDAAYAVGLILLAGTGLVLRARWAALPALGAAAIMGLWVEFLINTTYHVDNAAVLQGMTITAAVTCMIAGLAIAILAWRTARSHLGTLRAVLE